MNPLMECLDVSFSYDGQQNIFQEINFSLNNGDVFCILGANGTGKTTLIKCLTNLLDLTGGHIKLNGKDIKAMGASEVARNIGYIPQIHNSTFPFTVLDVVLMGRSPHLNIFESPSEKDYKIAQRSMEMLNISHMMNQSYTEISGGEQQLVFIARVLAQQPKIMILDEPTSHLDFGNQIRTLNIVNKLAENGLSVIMSSHFPDQAFISANKVAIMQDGGFIDMGTPEEVITSENMVKTYGINVKIVDIGDRMACIPLKF